MICVCSGPLSLETSERGNASVVIRCVARAIIASTTHKGALLFISSSCCDVISRSQRGDIPGQLLIGLTYSCRRQYGRSQCVVRTTVCYRRTTVSQRRSADDGRVVFFKSVLRKWSIFFINEVAHFVANVVQMWKSVQGPQNALSSLINYAIDGIGVRIIHHRSI